MALVGLELLVWVSQVLITDVHHHARLLGDVSLIRSPVPPLMTPSSSQLISPTSYYTLRWELGLDVWIWGGHRCSSHRVTCISTEPASYTHCVTDHISPSAETLGCCHVGWG